MDRIWNRLYLRMPWLLQASFHPVTSA
jgi:hypothetical protein